MPGFNPQVEHLHSNSLYDFTDNMTKSEGAGALLSAPLSNTVRSEVKFWRGQKYQSDQNGDQTGYKYLSDDFSLQMIGRTYERQFYHVYRSRLESLKPRVEEAARQKFGPSVKIRSLCDLGNDDESDEGKVLVIGTTFKNQVLKPSILKEISEDNEIDVQPINRKKVSNIYLDLFNTGFRVSKSPRLL